VLKTLVVDRDCSCRNSGHEDCGGSELQRRRRTFRRLEAHFSDTADIIPGPEEEF
jgi:hypothetical protein